MENQANHERFTEEDLRIENLIYLAGEHYVAASEPFERFCEDHSPKELRKVFGDRIGNGLDEDEELVAEELLDYLFDRKVLGFLVQFARPVRRYDSPTRYSSSWGSMNVKWIYADTLEEAIRLGHEWNAQRSKRDQKKSAA